MWRRASSNPSIRCGSGSSWVSTDSPCYRPKLARWRHWLSYLPQRGTSEWKMGPCERTRPFCFDCSCADEHLGVQEWVWGGVQSPGGSLCQGSAFQRAHPRPTQRATNGGCELRSRRCCSSHLHSTWELTESVSSKPRVKRSPGSLLMGISDFCPCTAGVHLPWHCSQPSLLSRKVLVPRMHWAGNKSGREVSERHLSWV